MNRKISTILQMFRTAIVLLFSMTTLPIQALALDISTLTVHPRGERPEMKVYRDTSGKLKIEDLLATSTGTEFVPFGEKTTSLGYTQDAIWLKFEVTNTSLEPKKVIFEVAYAILAYVDFYFVEPGKAVAKYFVGQSRAKIYPFSLYENPNVAQTIAGGAREDVYVRIQSYTSVNTNVVLVLLHLKSVFSTFS